MTHDGTMGDGDRGGAKLARVSKHFLPLRGIASTRYRFLSKRVFMYVTYCWIRILLGPRRPMAYSSRHESHSFSGGCVGTVEKHPADVVFKVELSTVGRSLCVSVDKRSLRFCRLSAFTC